MRPLEAGQADKQTLSYPLMAAPKLDGVRALVVDGVVLGKSLKPIRNVRVQLRFGKEEYNGLDGELIVGEHDDEVFNRTSSVVNSKIHEDDDKVAFWLFDTFLDPSVPFKTRYETLVAMYANKAHCRDSIFVVAYTVANDLTTVEAWHSGWCAAGYEGSMLRALDGKYKYGRSTSKEGILLKLKDFSDSEAVVVEKMELMHNGNKAEVNAKGLTERSSHKENKTPMGTLGALVVRDLITGVTFKIGTGYTSDERAKLWRDGALVGKIVKYKFFSKGVKDKPRFPVYLGIRDKVDMA